ncbi:MAG TPA: response regulator [Candidatus Lokiarchaeia archaeon]|nr:response regulator [Candidatus Lokiarchaeia archaeon]
MKNKEKDHQKAIKGHGNGELILVVDDEEAIRSVTTIMLRNNGYATLVASEGKEAVALYDAEKATIKLVILDLMMPVMDGKACIKALRDINPEVKIIGVSGFDKDAIHPELLTELSYFLEKPFTSKSILEAIRIML